MRDFQNTIADKVKEIIHKRAEILEKFCEAFAVSLAPHFSLMDYELVEQNLENHTIRWYFQPSLDKLERENKRIKHLRQEIRGLHQKIEKLSKENENERS